MSQNTRLKNFIAVIATVIISLPATAQGNIKWSADGSSYYKTENGEIAKYSLPQNNKTVILSKQDITPADKTVSLPVRNFIFFADEKKLLIYTNTKKVWRYDTRGDYWVYDFKNKTLRQLGRSLPASSLMFAKFSPDGTKAAYVSNYNIYAEDLATGDIKQLTFDGSRKFINGTFDWAYEEEFFCRDGFRWSSDSKKIAYWQINANETKDYLMLDNTDSIYPVAHPVEYPIAGVAPSGFRIGVLDIASAKTTWMNIPTDAVLQTYIPRMEWAANSNELIVQQLNRKQNKSDIRICDAVSGDTKIIYSETDKAWIDIIGLWDDDYQYGGWDWLNDGSEFLWASDKDGWRHLYRISRDGKSETLVTAGNYDVIDIVRIDEKNGFVYFMASPENATQRYLYKTSLKGNENAVRITPANQPGTHRYDISPSSEYAVHSFSNISTQLATEWITVAGHKPLNNDNAVDKAIESSSHQPHNTKFFKVKTTDGVEMDGWMSLPANFDSSKKYPVVFFVYTEPWGQTARDEYGADKNRLYRGSMADDGYIYVSMDNRGTPVPKGSEWRKCVYRKIGIINIRDQAMAAKEVLKWNFIDTSRVAVWGWSGGGSATLNLMFQYPDIYKTGIAIAAVANQLTYDNIYQERYMGLPQENKEDFVNGSPLTYAKNLKGNLLYIHGTGDDNVHFNNAEMLINELIKYNKQFQLMTYPNRTHSISEGEGTFEHLSTLYTNYLKQYCPPGGR